MKKVLFLSLVFCTSGLLFAQSNLKWDPKTHEYVGDQTVANVQQKSGDQAVYDAPAQPVPTPKNVQNGVPGYDKGAESKYKGKAESNKYECEAGFTLYMKTPNNMTFSCADTKKSVTCNTTDKEMDWKRINKDFRIVTISRGGYATEYQCNIGVASIK